MEQKQRILEVYNEMLLKEDIEGNWKSTVRAFVDIHNQFERLEKLGVFKDKKFGKRIKKMQDDLQKLTDEIDAEYG